MPAVEQRTERLPSDGTPRLADADVRGSAVDGVVGACAGNAPQPYRLTPRAAASRPAPRAPSPPPRSDRGNPPFYEVLGKRYHVLPTSEG